MANEQAEKRPRVASSLRDIAITFAFLGAAVGFFSGLSESPITATVIPLLFGLLTGGVGFSLAKVNLEKESDRVRLRAASIGLCWFVVTCLAAAMYSAAVRSGASLSEFMPRIRRPATIAAAPLPALENEPFDLATTALLLRRRLELLGASDQEVRVVLKRYERALAERLGGARLRSELSQIQTSVSAAYQQANAAAIEVRRAGRADDAAKIEDLASALSALTRTIQRWQRLNESGISLSAATVDSAARRFDDSSGSLATDYDQRREFSSSLVGTKFTAATITDVHEQLETLSQKLAYHGEFKPLLEDIDGVIRLSQTDVENEAPRLTRGARPSIKR